MVQTPAAGAERKYHPHTGPVVHVPLDRPGEKTHYKLERVLLDANYDTNTAFGDDLADQSADVGFHVFGGCPSCAHPTTALLASKYLTDYQTDPGNADVQVAVSPPRTRKAGLLNLDGVTAHSPGRVHPARAADHSGELRATNRRTQVLAMRCSCAENHPDQKDGTFGCGSEWLLAVNYDPTKRSATVLKLPVSAEDGSRVWQSADEVATAVSAALSSSQASATKWLTAYTSLLAVLGLAGVLAGRSTIQALGGGWQVLLAIAVLVALLGDIAMIALANYSSLGFPGLRAAPDHVELKNADLQPLLDAEASIKALRHARTATYVSACGALVAIGVFLFAPQPAATGDVKLTVQVPTAPSSGSTGGDTLTSTTQCGALSVAADKASYTLTPVGGGTAITYPAAYVTKIEKC
jgi:hypothetical protein